MARRLFQHFVSILGGQALNLIGQVVLVPLFLAHWSALRYGEWLVLSSVAVTLGQLDLGMNSAVGNRMMAAYARKDMLDFRRCQHSATAFYVCLAVGASLVMALLLWTLPLVHWVGVRATPRAEASEIAWLLSLQILCMLPIGLFGNTFRTMGLPQKTQWINNAKFVSFLVATAVALRLGGGMIAVAACQLIPMALMIAYVWWDLRRHSPELLPGLSDARWDVARELIRPSLLFALIMATTAAATQGSILVVSVTLGAAFAGTFVTTRTFCNAAMQIVRTINNAAWPDVTILYAQGEHARLRILHRLLISLSTCLCIAVAAAFWFVGPQVIAVWTHGRLKPPPDLAFVRWLLLYLVLQSPWLASSTFMIAINRHKAVSQSMLASTLLGLLAAALLVHAKVGLAGVPIGLIFGEAVACYYFVVHNSCRILEERTAPLLARVWLGMGAVGGLSLGAGWLAQRAAFGPHLAQWLEIGTATTLTALAATWALWLTPAERDGLMRKAGLKRSRTGHQKSPVQAEEPTGPEEFTYEPTSSEKAPLAAMSSEK